MHSEPILTRRELRRLREQPVPQADDTQGTPTILTVCTGNICRSPLAELLLRKLLADLDVRVHSAGTHAVERPMPEPSQQLALRQGADPDHIAAHRGTLLREPAIEGADLVLAMAREHRQHAVQLVPRRTRQTFTVREFARLSASLSDDELSAAITDAGPAPRARLAAALHAVAGQRGTVAPGDDDVIDPYRRSEEVYDESARQLVPAVEEVARVVRLALS